MRKYEYISCEKSRGCFLKKYLLLSIQIFPKAPISLRGYDEGCLNSPKADTFWLMAFRKGSINSFPSSMCRLFQPSKGRGFLLSLNMAALTFSHKKRAPWKKSNYSEITIQWGSPSQPRGKEPRKSFNNENETLAIPLQSVCSGDPLSFLNHLW